jgi:hypothetical protein
MDLIIWIENQIFVSVYLPVIGDEITEEEI